MQLNSVPAPAGLRHLRDVAAVTLAGAPEAIRRVEDPDERRLLINCAAQLQELITDRIDNRLLHWDLHYFNTLSTLDGASEWKAIDPKPLSGDSGFELLPALWNRWDDLVQTGDVSQSLLRRFDLMTDILGLDRARAAGWTLGRVLQNAVWDLVRFHEPHILPAHRTIAEVLMRRLKRELNPSMKWSGASDRGLQLGDRGGCGRTRRPPVDHGQSLRTAPRRTLLRFSRPASGVGLSRPAHICATASPACYGAGTTQSACPPPAKHSRDGFARGLRGRVRTLAGWRQSRPAADRLAPWLPQ